jgi:hypothetical protein
MWCIFVMHFTAMKMQRLLVAITIATKRVNCWRVFHRVKVYADLLSRYFICAPTMMIRKSVLDELGGYNEELSYEDFDFWIRSSRKYLYAFSDDILVKKRNLPNSLSKQQYRRNSKHFESTYTVCKMAVSLNRNAVEHKALRRRILYEAKMCAKNFKLIILIKYLSLMLRSYL